GVLAELVGRGLRAIALEVERRRYDLPLLFGQRAGVGRAAAATPAAAPAGHRLRAPEVLAERPHLDEVDVARRDLRSAHRVGVGRFREIRDEIPGLHAELLEVQRVARTDFCERLRPGSVQWHRAFLAAVDRVDEVEL